MRSSVLFLGLVAYGTVIAGSACRRREPAAVSFQSSPISNATTSFVSSTSPTVTSPSEIATAVTVAPDASRGQFTAVNDAILYAQSNGIPTVTVKAGTYTESVVIQATAAVAVVGETADAETEADYASNLVTISNTGLAVTYNVAAVGIAWHHIDFSNTDTASTAGVVFLRGSEIAFYGCKFVCAGSVCITSSYAAGLIANSYIEGADKLIYSYASLYVYGSTITATNNNALLVYNKGAVSSGVQYNSTVVFDSCSVIQKTDSTNTNVFLAAANSLGGSVVVYRNTSLAGFIAGTGAYADTKTETSPNTYIEFKTLGSGSYPNNAALRLGHVSWVTDSSQMKVYELPQFFADVYPTVATTDLAWIDSSILQAIEDDDARQDGSSSTPASSSSGAASSTTSMSQSSSASATFSASTTASATISASATAPLSPSSSATACILPSSVPKTALVVGPLGSCANYSSVSAAVAALPLDSTAQYIYILSGTYAEQVVFPNARTGATTFRGETADQFSLSSNTVTIKTSGAVLSSQGGAASTAAFQSTQYYTSQITFYNINFENDYAPTTNEQAVAVSIKAKRAAFYTCGIRSSQGSLLLNYGSFYFSNCHIEGTTDFIWGQGACYIYNSFLVSDGTATGQTIAAQQFQSSVGSSLIVADFCSVVPVSASVPQNSTYLGRDYSTQAHVAYTNSYLDGHIAPIGWKIASASTAAVTFVEANNTGPGSSTDSRASVVQLLSNGSGYSAAEVLGDISWLDSSAIAPFSGFPGSVYQAASANQTATPSSSASATQTSGASSTSSALYVVAPTPTGDQYGSVMSAISALPSDGQPYTIYVLAGTYTEQVWVNRTGKVSLRGETTYPNDFTQNMVTIQFQYGVLTSANEDETTPVINAKKTDGAGLAMYNIDFINTNPQTANTAALAADFYGTSIAAYGCSFVGYQDTLLANQGVQVFSNCYIEGSVDFIWGYSKAYFHQCYIAANTAGASISAQNRPSTSWAGGFVFDTCYVTYTSKYGSSLGKTYLGRPWSEYAVAVYMNSYLDKHINPAGWSVWSSSTPNTDGVLFGEYNNSGPGSWQSNADSRVTFATNLTAAQAASYTLSSFLSGSTNWIDATAYAYTPSYNLSGTTTGSGTATNSSATWAHPTSGTEPPAGAILVSPGGAVANSFANLTAALAALPDDATTQIIFVYPGTYEEQVPSVDRSGPVMIIGYTESDSPGSSYSGNTVTISQSRGLSVSPVPAGHSDAETATFSTASTKISLYNINIINTANLDGSQSSYVTLAASIDGNHIGFYGCSFIGWQDTLLTSTKSGYQYYESCYIEGAIDFIWGYSKAYFKGCTIGAKRAKSAITAQSRASASAIGGYIFDQCLFTAAPNATQDLTQLVYLGRPYSSYALVVVKNSYLDSIIQPSGWKVWSTTQPNTDHITFAEYSNSGPGNWENNAAARVAWQNCTLLTSDTFPLSTVMDSTDWIDLTYWDRIATPQPATPPSTPTNSSTAYDGTVPPAGAFVVCQTPVAGVTCYTTVQEALNVLPASSKTTAVVFIYPGVYEEQLVLNKSGTTIFMGYSNATGDYSQNQVTISFARGVDTQSDESNSDAATVYATGNYFQAININFANTFGTTADYATLGFAVRSSKYASLYGCQVYGNQDALLINGYFFAYNSYIEGNVDMIWGSGAGYFLSSTITPNEDGISLTADKRATNTTAGGFVFDQCTITPAGGASFSQISLGRPWNNYARVAYIESNLGSCVMAAGWSQWSNSKPQTDGVLFGEYANYGAGASTASRVSFATQLTADVAAQFELASFFATTSWINMTLVHAVPFTAGNATVPPESSSAISTAILSTEYFTAYTTAVTTVQEMLTLTTTAAGQTTTIKSTTTLDLGTTIAPSPTTVVTIDKLTTTVTSTVAAATSTTTKTETTVVDSTVTPTPSTKTSKTTVTVVSTTATTATAKASTVKSTTTITVWTTSTPKATTITVSETSTVYAAVTRTHDAVSTTSTTTTTVGNTGAITVTSTKATTTTKTVETTSTKTTTKTTSLSCIPTAARMIRRTVAAPVLEDSPSTATTVVDRRAVDEQTTTIVVYSTVTTDVKTSFTTVPGQTFTVESDTTKTTGKTKTGKPTTYTVTSTSVSTKYTTTTPDALAMTVSAVVTETSGKTTTLKAGTTTVFVTVDKTSTSTAEVTLPASIVTSWKTKTVKSTTVLPTTVTTTTAVKTTTDKSTTTLPVATTTVWKTATLSLTPALTVTVWPSTVTKTTTDVVSTTVTHWVTKTSKGAAVCTK